MRRNSILLDLLDKRDWAQFQPLVDRFQGWAFYPLFLRAVEELNLGVLYESDIHGIGHIERTLCHGAMCAMDEALSQADTGLLLDACAYHDIGRTRDGLDFVHGSTAARFIGLVTGRTGEDLLILQAAVEAHSRKEKELSAILQKYRPQDMDRALTIAQLLKDADGLDRVRIWDLDVRFLRRTSSIARADFAQELYNRYQPIIGLPLMPAFVPEMKKHQAEMARVWE